MARVTPQYVKDLRRAYVNDVRAIAGRSEKLLKMGTSEECLSSKRG
jgi:hypothetical protein